MNKTTYLENEIIYRDCYVDAINGTRDVCDDSSDLSCSKCSGKLCNSDKQRRGTKCFKCNGIDCFNAEYPANVVDCLSNCYVGVNREYILISYRDRNISKINSYRKWRNSKRLCKLFNNRKLCTKRHGIKKLLGV